MEEMIVDHFLPSGLPPQNHHIDHPIVKWHDRFEGEFTTEAIADKYDHKVDGVIGTDGKVLRDE